MKKLASPFALILFCGIVIVFPSLSLHSAGRPVHADSIAADAKSPAASRMLGAPGKPAAVFATITVKSSADSGGSCPGANCTLRQAIATAAAGDTIDFDMTTVTSPITLASELAIDKSLQVQGPGASLLTISGNNAVRVFNIGSVTPAINVTISGLTIANGRHLGAVGSPAGNGIGGGILNNSTGTLTISNSVISGNQAIGGGGQGFGGALYNASTGIVNIFNSTLSGNLVRSESPGLYSEGGAIFNTSGTVNLTGSTVSGNAATTADVQIGQPGSNCIGVPVNVFFLGSAGGGIFNGNGGTLNVTNCNVSGNSVNGGTITSYGPYRPTVGNGYGGGIANGGASSSGGTLNVTNSTLAGNTINGVVFNLLNCAASVGIGVNLGGGGAIYTSSTANLTNVTLYGNTVTGITGVNGGANGQSIGGGVADAIGGLLNAKNTIIAGNSAELGPDVNGTLTSQGWNLIGNNKDASITPSPGTADQIGTNASPINPLLGPLADNGGLTKTLALLAGSPARDKGAAAIDPISSTPVSTDQRGFARPVDDPAIANATGGNGSDIGAFEAQLAACSTLVTNTNDSGVGSLREAVICSNLTAGTQTITFANGLSGTITLTSGEMVIFDSVNIVGPGASVITVSGNNSSRIFNIASGNFNITISDLTIANGKHRGTDGITPSDGFGGGILNNSTGVLAISNSLISNNSAIGGNNSTSSITAPGALGIGGGIYNASTGTLNITNSGISGNIARGGNGVGGFQISTFLGGRGTAGGIFNSNGTVNLHNCSLTGNMAINGDSMSVSGSCAAVPGSPVGVGSLGGGLSNASGIVNITHSTVSGNSANGGSYLNSSCGTIVYFASGGLGGGIFNNTGTIRVINSTFFGNAANGITISGTIGATNVVPLPSFGGGISNGGQLILTNSTFAGNAANGTPSFNGGPSSTGNGGGVQNSSGATVTAKNTIIATNTGDIGPDFEGTLTSQGWNLIGNIKDATIAATTGDQIGTPGSPINPMLGPLANNGGATQTMALLAGSPARDKGAAATDPISSMPVTTDQRGFTRPVDDPAIANATGGNGSDIGAFEVDCRTICPVNQTVNTGSGSTQCGAVVNYPTPTTTGDCGSASCSPAAGSFFPVGTTTVTCATPTGPNCSFTITVVDTTPPNPTCPANLNVNILPSQQCATVNYTTPAANDNCSGTTVNCSPASGTCFPTGTTTVTCTAMDTSKNTATCSFTVTVSQQACTITCPANITKSNDANQCGAVVNYSAPTTTGSCGTVTCSPASGSFFAKGTTTVTCTTTAGASCTFTITIVDTQAPQLTLMANRTAAFPNQSSSCVVVNYPTPVASDNCPGATVVCTPAPGSCFPLGTTTVNCTATDSSANTATSSFTIAVFDVCLQDDANAGMVLLFNTQTGDYLYCCGNTRYTGKGTITRKGSTWNLQHFTSERRVEAYYEGTQYRGNATLQSPIGNLRCALADRDTRNNSCVCGAN